MDYLTLLGFTYMDKFFLITSFLIGGVGAIVDYLCRRCDFTTLKVDQDPIARWKAFVPLILSRVIIGCIAGALMWMILFDIIDHSKNEYIRLVILSLMAGVTAPSFVANYSKKINTLLKNENDG